MTGGFTSCCACWRTPVPEGATHIAWATGGGMVPEDVWREYYRLGG